MSLWLLLAPSVGHCVCLRDGGLDIVGRVASVLLRADGACVVRFVSGARVTVPALKTGAP